HLFRLGAQVVRPRIVVDTYPVVGPNDADILSICAGVIGPAASGVATAHSAALVCTRHPLGIDERSAQPLRARGLEAAITFAPRADTVPLALARYARRVIRRRRNRGIRRELPFKFCSRRAA